MGVGILVFCCRKYYEWPRHPVLRHTYREDRTKFTDLDPDFLGPDFLGPDRIGKCPTGDRSTFYPNRPQQLVSQLYTGEVVPPESCHFEERTSTSQGSCAQGSVLPPSTYRNTNSESSVYHSKGGVRNPVSSVIRGEG